MKISDYIVNYLIELGVTHVFTLPGGFSMHLNDSLNYSSITPVSCLHESAAGFAANGYSKYTGGLSVAMVTSGPGSTNILTAVADAWQDSLPLLVISGEAKTGNIEMRHKYQLRQGGVQDIDIMPMVSHITKYNATLLASSMTRQVLDNAVRFAMQPRRGPVWVSIPLDVQAEEI